MVQYDERLALSESMLKVHEENLLTAKQKEEISGEVLETYQVSSKLHFVTDKYIEEQDLKEVEVGKYKRYVGKELTGKVCRPIIDETKVPKSLKEAIELAILRNHKIQEQIENIKKQREKIAQYDARFLPSLNLELKAYIDDDLALPENGTTNARYGRINLDWNLFNGNRDSIRSEQEELFLQQQKKTLDEVTNEVVAEITSLYSKFNKNKQRIESLKKYVDANMNIVEVYKNEFESGTRTFVDILDAESELYNSSQSLINMEYNALNNYYDLMFNLAQLTDSVLSNPNQDCAKVEPRVIAYNPKKQDKNTEAKLEGLISHNDSKMIAKELGLDSTNVSAAKSIKEETPATSTVTGDYSSFLDAPKGYYTINLATKNGINDANAYINENNLSDKAIAFGFGPDMRSAKVLYGIFPSVKDAKAAMKNLNSSILEGKPYIDNISKHQALYAKYHN